MKKKKTAQGVAILFIMALLAGCGTSKEAAELNTYLAQNHPAPEKKSSPAPEELAAALEDAGFTVERHEEVKELGITAQRVKAVKDEAYFDVCYSVTDEQDVQDIMEYYIEQYDRCSIIVNDEGTVFCYSSEAVAQQAGFLAE